MSLNSAAILVDGTVATTGGTSTNLLKISEGNDSFVAYLDDSSEFLATTTVTFTTSRPKVNTGSPNGYTQARCTAIIKKPLLLDNGEYTVNKVTITLSVDHETTDAEIESLLVSSAQLLHDSDFSNFWKKQSLA